MASVLAIISKAVFERDARRPEGGLAGPGDTVPLDRYLSANKGLRPLAEGGTLFLVTVRPPDERLWLVAALEQPRFEEDHWAAVPNTVPITDVTELLPRIKLATGKGISAAPGRLGMSLQTPRALAEEDVALLSGEAAPAGRAAGADASLLDAVIAAPDDDAPRLVLADWLMERGDPRGELIAAQVGLASGQLYRSQRAERRARARELLDEHRGAWTACGPRGGRFVFRRGFIHEVVADAAELLNSAARLFAAEPVQKLRVEDCSLDELERLCRAPWLRRVTALTLRGELGDEGAELLAGAAGLSELRLLNLYDCGIGEEGAAALAASSVLATVRTLTLTANPIGDEGAQALARSPSLERCEKLFLARTEIGNAGVAALAGSPHLRNLRELGLGSNYSIGEPSVQVLIDSPHLGKIRWIEVDGTDIGWEAVGRLRERFPRLRA